MKSPVAVKFKYKRVASSAGAWIEIFVELLRGQFVMQVAPSAGAWIEIGDSGRDPVRSAVAPYAGAWIEIPGHLVAI